jgi:hypothetical protein
MTASSNSILMGSFFEIVFFPQDANAKAIEKRRMEIFKRDLIFDLF